jgi:hypothetical protein
MWHTPVIPALGRLRQEDLKFKASLVYIVKPCLKNPKEKDSIAGFTEEDCVLLSHSVPM